MKEKRDRLAKVGTKGRFSSETILIDVIGIKAELNLSCHQEVVGVLLVRFVLNVFHVLTF